MSIRIVDVTAPDGAVIEPELLAAAFPVHAQLRPELKPERYVALLERVFADGARMMVGLVDREGAERIAVVAVWRHYMNTHDGMRFYVDDLVTDSAERSGGVGKVMLDALRERAVELGCNSFTLDSGTHRAAAHRFYFRERMTIGSFAFRQVLK
ncbi:GNAT family N-acetyltransferase [soil metagenome]